MKGSELPNRTRFDRPICRWLGLVTIGAVTLVALWARGGTALGTSEQPVASGLKAPSRDRLAVCVEAVRGVDLEPGLAVGRVRSALERAVQHPASPHLGFNRVPRAVDYGCPLRPLLFDGEATPTDVYQRLRHQRPVTAPSAYRVFLFVIPDRDVQDLFQGRSIYSRTAAEEGVCDDTRNPPGVCGMVTSGVYISTSELLDASALEYAVLRGLSLVGPPNLPRSRDIRGSDAPGRR